MSGTPQTSSRPDTTTPARPSSTALANRFALGPKMAAIAAPGAAAPPGPALAQHDGRGFVPCRTERRDRAARQTLRPRAAYRALDVFSATAARMSALKAPAST